MIKTIKNLMMVLTLAIVGTSVNAVAQKLSFGYLSYNSILQNMPDYATAKERVKMLREQYDKEAEYNEDKLSTMQNRISTRQWSKASLSAKTQRNSFNKPRQNW